ncbi:MAG: DUF1636 domain-containing protein [Pseudomonadota bacterium]
MYPTVQEPPLLSICMTCRDGREDRHDGVRGGARFAESLMTKVAEAGRAAFVMRGVRCMSQCKRACTLSLTAPGAFTWIFGDLDPERHGDDVLTLMDLYRRSPDGFMARADRPEPMRAGVLGRLPPIASDHEVIEPLPLLAGRLPGTTP